jgi:hypothetical protein
VVQGVIFVFCVLEFRSGIVGVIASYAEGRRKRLRATGAAATADEPAAGTAAAPRAD